MLLQATFKRPVTAPDGWRPEYGLSKVPRLSTVIYAFQLSSVLEVVGLLACQRIGSVIQHIQPCR
jgi:hypothetical protein